VASLVLGLAEHFVNAELRHFGYDDFPRTMASAAQT
jgi:hypothetical protein